MVDPADPSPRLLVLTGPATEQPGFLQLPRLLSELTRAGLPPTVLPAAGWAAAAGRDRPDAPDALLAIGTEADSVVGPAAGRPGLCALALVGGRLSDRELALLAEWDRLALLCAVEPADRTGTRQLVDAYLSAAGPGSRLLWPTVGVPDCEVAITRWCQDALASAVPAREVTFATADGWQVYGNLLLPTGSHRHGGGVVLLHSGRSDRFTLSGLERTLAAAGFAVLNIDWRGRGRTVNLGHYFALPAEVRARGDLDVRAAVDFLAGQPGVVADRLAAVGVVHGAEHAVRAAVTDRRLRALVLLTGYLPRDDSERTLLTDGEMPVFYVSCSEHGPVTSGMRSLYRASRNRATRLLTYPGGAIGYQLLELDRTLAPTIASWLTEVLVESAEGGEAAARSAGPPPLAAGAAGGGARGAATGSADLTAARPGTRTGAASPSGPATRTGPAAVSGQPVRLVTVDGWQVGGTCYRPAGGAPAGGVLLVPASGHEQDGYGPLFCRLLVGAGYRVLSIDLRGRGASRVDLPLAEMPPAQRLRLRDDLAAGVDWLAAADDRSTLPATHAGPAPTVMMVAEQDSAGPALWVADADRRVGRLVLLSPRFRRLHPALPYDRPLLVVVSGDDRALRESVTCYLDSKHPASRLLLLDGLGMGSTMFSTWQFGHPGEPPLEETVVRWVTGSAD